MSAVATMALGLLAILIVLHLATVAMIRHRVTTGRRDGMDRAMPEPIALVVPIAGLDADETLTALAALDLAGPAVELVYCGFRDDDPAVVTVRAALAARPGIAARVLVGRDRVSDNPKMDNLEKAVEAVAADLVVFADGNLDMPADMIDRLTACWDGQTGAVSSPPIGTRPQTFWAEVECTFLNTLFARWQLAAEQLGGGFAHGKVFMVRRSQLAALGGLECLYRDTAEDAAVTRMVRGAGLEVRLTRRPFEQPLGRRSFAEVWNRNLRWARLRRRAYLSVYALEIFNTFVAPAAALGVAAVALGWSAPSTLAAILAVGVVWYGAEAVLARAAGWPWSPRFYAAAILRDLLMPAIWAIGWFGSSYVWRGENVQIRGSHSAPPVAPEIAPR